LHACTKQFYFAGLFPRGVDLFAFAFRFVLPNLAVGVVSLTQSGHSTSDVTSKHTITNLLCNLVGLAFPYLLAHFTLFSFWKKEEKGKKNFKQNHGGHNPILFGSALQAFVAPFTSSPVTFLSFWFRIVIYVESLI